MKKLVVVFAVAALAITFSAISSAQLGGVLKWAVAAGKACKDLPCETVISYLLDVATQKRTPIVLNKTEKGGPREGTNGTVWDSAPCPLKAHAISGVCIVSNDPTQTTQALQNFGPEPVDVTNEKGLKESRERFTCAWRGPLKSAEVRALCLQE
jgi:hypothetical protein